MIDSIPFPSPIVENVAMWYSWIGVVAVILFVVLVSASGKRVIRTNEGEFFGTPFNPKLRNLKKLSNWNNKTKTKKKRKREIPCNSKS